MQRPYNIRIINNNWRANYQKGEKAYINCLIVEVLPQYKLIRILNGY